MEKIFDIRHIFEPALVIAFLISAVCYAIYYFWFRKPLRAEIGVLRRKFGKKESKKAIYATTQQIVNNPVKKFIYFWADLFGVLFIVVFLRSFVIEPFVIPSASMYPGLIEGDIVVVNKNVFGIRLPVLGTKITDGAPKRGDVTVFKYPKDEKVNYIKRTIGVAGDKIEYDNRSMKVNNKPIVLKKQPELTYEFVDKDKGFKDTAHVFEEIIGDKPHAIQYLSHNRANFRDTFLTVPKNHYLMLGDNRDYSSDGRDWGYVKDDKILGKATYILFNWRCLKGDGYCDRFFKKIK